jgi:hypothetical protein
MVPVLKIYGAGIKTNYGTGIKNKKYGTGIQTKKNERYGTGIKTIYGTGIKTKNAVPGFSKQEYGNGIQDCGPSIQNRLWYRYQDQNYVLV